MRARATAGLVFLLLALAAAGLAGEVHRSASSSRVATQHRAEVRAVDRMAGDLDALLATASQLRRTTDLIGVAAARERFPGLAQQTVAVPVATAVALEEVVPARDRARFARSAGFSIDRPARGRAGRPSLVITSAVSTEVAGSSLWGIDVLVDPARRRILRRAFASGAPRATAPVAGLRRPGTGLTVYLPLRRRPAMPMPDTIGVSLDLDAIGTELRSSLPAGTQVAIRDDGRLIVDTDRSALGGTARPYAFAGRSWQLLAAAPLGAVSGLWLSVLAGGLVVAALLSVILYSGLSRLRRVAEQREVLARRVGDLFVHSPLGLVVTDAAHRVIEVNGALEALLGTSADQLVGRSLAKLIDHRDRDRVLPVGSALAAGQTATLSGEVRLVRADGSSVWTHLVATPQRDAHGALLGLLLQADDIEQSRSERAALQRLAEHDPLTRAQNRRSFEARVEAHLASCRGQGARGALYVIDLDRFKQVNDVHGHAVGDRLLVAVADALRRCLRDADALARLGGDEFAILLADGTRPADLEAVASRVRDSIADICLETDGEVVCASASVGWAAADPALRVDELLRTADDAMYRTKRSGQPA